MAAQWSDIIRDPEYTVLSEEEKTKVRKRYFDNVVSTDPGFKGLDDAGKQKVQSQFFTDEPSGFKLPGPVKSFLVERTADIFTEPFRRKQRREALTELVGGGDGAIEKEARETGEVPFGRIARRTAMETATELIPVTKQEFAIDTVSGLGIGKVTPIIGRIIAKRFPKLFSTLNKSRKVFEKKPPPGKPLPPQPETTVLQPNLQPAKKLPEGPAVTPEETVRIAQAQKTSDVDIFNQQLNKFNVSEDAQAVFQETSKIFKPRIDKARRGKIDFKGTEELARNLGMTPEDLLKRRKGKAFNAEELEAAKGLTGRSLNDVNASRQAYLENPNPENLVKLNASISRHAATQESFMGARAEAGRALQILRKSTDPADIAQQNFDDLLKAFGGREFSEEMAKRLASIDPTDVAGLNRFIRGSIKAKTTDQLYEVWINGLLSSPVTQVRNIMGNSLFISSKVPEKATKALVDTAISPFFSGARTRLAGEAKQELFAIGKGLADGTRRALHALRTGVPEAKTKLELSRVPAIPGKIGEAVRLPSRALIAGDEFAKGIVNRMETAAQIFRKAKLEGKTGEAFIKRMAELEANPTDDILKAVRKEELLRTFQTRSPFIRKLGALRDIGPMKFVVPFLQTPANIAIRGIERSPIGIFTHLLPAVLKKKGQAAIAEAGGNALVGSAVAGTIAYQTLQGKITGSPPRDPVARDKFFRSGKLPYSVKIGDTWYSYSAFEPWALTVGATADATLKAIDANAEPDKNVVGAIVSAIPRFMVSQTFLSGMRDFMDAVSDGERYGNRYINRLAGSVVPFSSFNRWIAQNLDPVIRRPEGVLESVKAGLPGLSKQVPALRTATGEPAVRPSFQDSALTGVLKNLAIPSRKEQISPLDVEDEFLERRTTFPSKSIGGIKLNNKEFQEMKSIAGQNITKFRKEIQKTPEWKRTSPDGRNKVLDAVVRAARKDARIKLYPQLLRRTTDKEQRQDLLEYGQRVLGITE